MRELLELVGLLPEIATRYPHQLSGGQKQRVGFARALAADPAILLMDEPFGALDPLTRDELQREFLSLQQRMHKTVVFVTHDLREALRLGSRIALMEAGKLVTVLEPQEFVKSTDRWASAYVRAFGAGLEPTENRGTSMNVIRFMWQNHTQVLELSLEHLWLVGYIDGIRDVDRDSARHRDCSPAAPEQAGPCRR